MLQGGSVPVFDEVIINLASMNKVRSLDKVSGIVTCDAGIVLEVLDNHLAESGYMVPLDLGAKGRYVLRIWKIELYMSYEATYQLSDRWQCRY